MEPTETYTTTDREEIDTICREARALGHEIQLFAKTVKGEVEYEVHFFHKDGIAVPEPGDEEVDMKAAEDAERVKAEEAASQTADKKVAAAKAKDTKSSDSDLL